MPVRACPERCCSECRVYDPNRVVIRQDQPSTLVATVRNGWLYRYRKLQNGRQQIISFIIPGDFLTFSSHSRPEIPVSFGVKSVSRTALCVFERDHFLHAVTQEAAYTADFHRESAAYEELLHRRLADIGQRSAKARLGQLLLELYRRHSARGMIKDNGFDFPISQDLLAKALALTKAYVNRCLSSLKRGGVIQLADRRLTVLDMEQLKAIAEEE
jgi:CRP-like cAMP-binding protein